MTFLVFTAAFTFLLLLFGRRGSAVRGGTRLRHEIDALFSGEHDYEPTSPERFPHADLGFYDRVERELGAMGFRKVGDVEDLTLSRVYPDRRTFVRLLVDDGALIRAGAFHLRARGGLTGLLGTLGVVPRDVYVVELVTEVQRGRFLVTAPTRGLDRLDPPPEAEVERLRPGTPLAELVARHRERVGAHLRRHTTGAPVEVRDLDGVLASVQRGHVVASAHRQRIGRLSRDELERMTGTPLDPQQAELLHEVQRGDEPDGGDGDDGDRGDDRDEGAASSTAALPPLDRPR
ncbi:MAG: hypothetical protein H6709_03905 [Kofleriaceae bacterium]|nr:hypothetical protein [Myxococcales bacterium]MCB9560221.1 hypothetical protein [Kofleriaceae bacterium]MCB9571214.1 hypothetical protein [Kofleriaceae bacterium]